MSRESLRDLRSKAMNSIANRRSEIKQHISNAQTLNDEVKDSLVKSNFHIARANELIDEQKRVIAVIKHSRKK